MNPIAGEQQPNLPESSGLASPWIDDREIFLRMNRSERLQHVVLVVCFSLLVLSGLPLMFDPASWIGRMFFFKSSFAIRGWIHRAAGVGLIVLSLFHIGYLCTRQGRRLFKALRFQQRDLIDAVRALGHNLGISTWLHKRGILAGFFSRYPFWLFAEPPRYGRYNFIEKFEYLAVLWGNAVMILTGILLWATNFCLRWFPLWILDVIRVVHSYEATLAFLAIIVWHLYNVHLNPVVFPMSRVWINGKISARELREMHPLEYQEIVRQRQSDFASKRT